MISSGSSFKIRKTSSLSSGLPEAIAGKPSRLALGKHSNLEIEDYNSHNTTRLEISEIKKLLLKLDFIKDNL